MGILPGRLLLVFDVDSVPLNLVTTNTFRQLIYMVVMLSCKRSSFNSFSIASAVHV